MSEKEPFYYDEKYFRRDVGDLKDPEIALLADNYPSYRIKNWRMTLLEGIKEGWDNYTIFCNKIRDKKIDLEKYESEGGHGGMIGYKIRRAAFRLLYLRYRLEGFTRPQSNTRLRINHFPNEPGRTIRDNTFGCLIDEKDD